MPESRQATPAPTPTPMPTASGPERRGMQRDELGFTLRSLEPWIAWSIAAYTAAVALVLHAGDIALWLFVVYALLVGKWAEQVPAHRQRLLLFRAFTLGLAAFVLMVTAGPGSDGPRDAYLVWVAVTTLFYASLLRPLYSWMLICMSLCGFAGAWVINPGAGRWQLMLAQAALIYAVAPLVALRFGLALHDLESALERSLRDRATGLYNQAGLQRHGEKLVSACKDDKVPASLVMFDARELPLGSQHEDARAAREGLLNLAESLRELAGERGLAARTGEREFCVLLPGVPRDKLLRSVHKQLGSPPSVMLGTSDGKRRITLGMLTRDLITERHGLTDVVEELSHLTHGDPMSGGDAQDAGLSVMPDEPDAAHLTVSEVDDTGFAQTAVMQR